jgi:hypothetical protein
MRWHGYVPPHGRWCDDVHFGPAGALVCQHCGEWLSLGPSNDSPPEVQVEIRAAEIAATYPGARSGVFSWEERTGWVNHAWSQDPASDSELAGYLARTIATHPDADTDATRREGEGR